MFNLEEKVIKPYKDFKTPGREDKKIRTFKREHLKATDLVWHRDNEDRQIKVLFGSGWKFQRDNDIPVELKRGDIFEVKKEEWHRIFKGSTDLVIEIKVL